MSNYISIEALRENRLKLEKLKDVKGGYAGPQGPNTGYPQGPGGLVGPVPPPPPGPDPIYPPGAGGLKGPA